MPEIEREEVELAQTIQEQEKSTQESLEKLRRRLETTQNRDLTPRQVEMYYLGAVFIKDHQEPEYDTEKDFIDEIIASHEQNQKETE